jgi:hypothetical protein
MLIPNIKDRRVCHNLESWSGGPQIVHRVANVALLASVSGASFLALLDARCSLGP